MCQFKYHHLKIIYTQIFGEIKSLEEGVKNLVNNQYLLLIDRMILALRGGLTELSNASLYKNLNAGVYNII